MNESKKKKKKKKKKRKKKIPRTCIITIGRVVNESTCP